MYICIYTLPRPEASDGKKEGPADYLPLLTLLHLPLLPLLSVVGPSDLDGRAGGAGRDGAGSDGRARQCGCNVGVLACR